MAVDEIYDSHALTIGSNWILFEIRRKASATAKLDTPLFGKVTSVMPESQTFCATL